MERVVLERVAGVLALVSALVHGGLAPSHLEEWWGYGLLFLAAAACQAVLGLALLVDPLPATDPWAARVRRWTCGAGLAGSLALVALYAVTRTTGVPLGPEAGETEPVDALGVLTVAIELATAGLLAWRLRRS